MDFKLLTLATLRRHRGALDARRAVVGLDGFVDTIVSAVDLRHGPGEAFRPIDTITAFGQRILAAAGKSANIELHPRLDKLGGNGPILAHALLTLGPRVKYVGAVGWPELHPVFRPLGERAEVISLGEPASTLALEFSDGKLMLGRMQSLDAITYDHLVATVGFERLRDSLEQADLVALVNWTMVPHMTGVFQGLADQVLPALSSRRERRFFFDLADPEKRSPEDLRLALQAITRFADFGPVTLGLNLKESQQVAAALGIEAPEPTGAALARLAERLRRHLALDTVVIHPRDSAACATRQNEAWVPGPYTDHPLITTGAGDHFNAGFLAGQLLGAAPEICLGLGVATSGHYVRTAESPTGEQLETFLANWK